ncbi:MAG: MotA/TolQ/ExbB proton channel family protein [Gemmataceae bacterium]|nr:MotA/TolQ/ExbB proton channel family protein [Gemmataceae bacterium]MDW8265858.1 MotA/TolQ/ExbB proton channel family protein [Gemmataceae bacterium]
MMDLRLWDNTLLDLFHRGGPCMWPLLACSVLGLAVILDRAAALLRVGMNFPKFVARLRPLIRAHRLAEARELLSRSPSPVARVAEAYLDSRHRPAALREEVVSREGSMRLARLERRLSWLSMIASVSTLIGLLGTVTGLVAAFHQIEIKAGQVQPGDLASGIWEALLTTVFGLVVAIPCLAAYHLFDHRVGTVAQQMEWIAAYLDEWFEQVPPAKAAEPIRPPPLVEPDLPRN